MRFNYGGQDVKNAFTVDVEDWYQTMDFDIDSSQWDKYEDRVQQNTEIILDIMDKSNTKGTFFILGCVAEKHPDLVKDIIARGHEIGSHGMWHRMVTRQTPDEFRQDIRTSKKILEDISGTKVDLYRASSWSINKNTIWAFEILVEEGFKCDSSVQPFETPLSGMKNANCEPFYPIINNKRLDIIEFPSTVLKIGAFRLPFSGGFYLRILPYMLLSNALKLVNKSRSGMVYAHPWEIDDTQPRLAAPFHIRLLHYANLRHTSNKLEKLLKQFDFVPLGELLKNKKFPDVVLK